MSTQSQCSEGKESQTGFEPYSATLVQERRQQFVLVHGIAVTPSYVQQGNAISRRCWSVVLCNCNLQTREVNLRRQLSLAARRATIFSLAAEFPGSVTVEH